MELIPTVMAAAVVLLGGVSIYLNRALKRERLQRIALAESVQRMDGEIAALSRGAVGMGQRVVGLEHYWRETKEQHERFEMSHGKERQYDHALRLIHGGASVEDILSSCDFTRSEAELMVRMNQFQQTG